MLEMDEGRFSFADALRPLEGYELSFAVGTTYSLDLKALLGLCIPLGLGFEPEALQSINPVSLFAALKRLQGKLAVYCDKGSIKADISNNSNTSGLLMLLEGMVHQVHVNWRRKDALSSFHPKVWVAEYTSKHGEENCYRLLVMSRNLTFDTSWDAVAILDGRPGEPNECSEHLAHFLEFLADGDSQTTTERDDTRRNDSHAARVRKLANAVRNVEFKVDDKQFDAVDFLPFGPQAQGGNALLDASQSELLSGHHHNLLVVSPFLSDGDASPLVKMISNRSGETGRFVLLSREDSLSSLNYKLRQQYDCFCPVPSLSDVEIDSADGAEAADYSNLHAKIYFTESGWSKRVLYIGSLNASYNGTVNNVEALLKLSVGSGYLTFPRVLQPLIGGEGKTKPPFSPFIPAESESTEIDDMQEFRKSFRVASRLVSFRQAVVCLDDDGTASIKASLEIASVSKQCEDVHLSIRPLFLDDEQPIELTTSKHNQELVFEGLELDQVSALFVLKGVDGEGHSSECITICPHGKFDDANLSLESRSTLLLGKLLAHDNAALSGYIAHAFDLPEASYSINEATSQTHSTSNSRNTPIPPGMYERLLNMADTSPEIFDQASYLMGLIPDEVKNRQLEELRTMLETFRRAVR